MTRIDSMLAQRMTLSIELWPPRSDEAKAHLEQALEGLYALEPDFASITYGAGGSTRERTHELVVEIEQGARTEPMAHLTCAAHRREELEEILRRYADAGVDNVLALLGDPPAGATDPLPSGELSHAIELVELAKSVAPFCVAVAAHPSGHPASKDLATDRRYLAEKLALADFAITQIFFDIDEYLRLVDDVLMLGVDKPILPGVMPITSSRSRAWPSCLGRPCRRRSPRLSALAQTIQNLCVPSASRSEPGCATSSLRSAHRACTSTR